MDSLKGLDPLLEEESPVGILSFDRDGRIRDTNPALLRFLGSPSKEVTSRINVLTDLPLVQAGIAGDLRRALEEKVVVSAEHDYTSRLGRTLRGRVTVFPLLGPHGAVEGAQAIVEDRTASRSAEGLVRVLRDLGRALASADSAPTALERILDAALMVEGIDCGGVYAAEEGELRLKAHRGFPEEVVARVGRYGPDDPQTRLVSAGEPVFRTGHERSLPPPDAAGGEGLRASAVLPVRHDGRVVGALNAASRAENEISLPARDTLEAIASRIGNVLARGPDLTDPVTGLLTRRGLEETGEREVLRAVRLGRPLHALLLEVDRLREIRVSHGNAVADSIIRAVSRRCRAAVRDIDLISREVGDTLLVLLSETGADELARISERLRSEVGEGPFPTPAGDFAVSASIGICAAGPGAPGLSALLAGAEAALSSARSEGGNRTVMRS
jgi:diguanylate cyclase (GGDEF)-like protein/PAS domain S-box-containing protein